MPPADQRLDADRRPVAGGDLGLIVQLQHVVEQGLAQLAEQAEPVGRVQIALGLVGLDAGALLLGVVHRDVGAAQQRGRVRAMARARGHADGRVDLEREAAKVDRIGHSRVQPLGDGDQFSFVRVVDDDRELVAPEPGDQVAPAGPRRAAGRRI